MKKGLLVILIVVLALLVAAVAGFVGYRWYLNTHFFIYDAVYEADAESLDLRGTGVSEEHYEQLRAAMPNCEIRWDVPFQGGRVDSNTRELEITCLTE